MNDFGQRTSVSASSSAVGGAFAAGTEPGWNWGYDAKGQMVSSQHVNTAASSRYYAYDGMGNRTQHRDGTHLSTVGTATAYTPDALNQYDAIGGLTPVYDADGNLTSGPLPVAPGALSTLAWNGENRLHQVAVSGGSTVQYHYDAQGRRIAMTKGSTRTYWVYDGWNIIAEYTGTVHTTGTAPTVSLQKTWLWGLDLSGSLQGAGGVGGLLAMSGEYISTAPTYYPLYDGNGNAVQYLHSGGNIVARFQYDGFGRELVALGPLAPSLPHRFSTKYRDSDTGLNYYGYRFYDPLTGRWPSRDPIEEEGGVNLYGFVGNDGGNRWDKLGREFYAGYVPKPGEIDHNGNLKPGSETCEEWSQAQALAQDSNNLAKEYFNQIAQMSEEEFKKKTKNGVFVIWESGSVQDGDGNFNGNAEQIKVNVTRGEMLIWLREEQGSMAELYKTGSGDGILRRYAQRSNEELYRGYKWTSSAFVIHGNSTGGIFANGMKMSFDALNSGVSGIRAKANSIIS